MAQHAHLSQLLHHARISPPQEHDAAWRNFLQYFSGYLAVESVLIRPLVPQVDGSSLGLGRDAEEAGMAQQIKHLQDMDATTPIYRTQFSAFEEAVSKHLAMEQEQELPQLVARLRDDQAAEIIEALTAVAHSAGQRSGSYAEMLQQAKEQVSSAAPQ